MARQNEVLDYSSKYRDESGVYYNKQNIKDQKKLDELERTLTTYKLSKLYLYPGKQTFDVEHYLNIHKYLFEDLYPFAGEIRSENIKKTIPFCTPNLIYNNLKNTLKEAKKRSSKISCREELVDFITDLLPELDIIHPFMEGNGRCEREFLRQYTGYICKKNNIGDYTLLYSNISNKESFIKAVIIADARCDTTYLRPFIDSILKYKTKNDNNKKFY